VKKLFGVILTIAIALAIAPLSSGAAPKPVVTPKTGASCSPVGKTVVVGTKKFSCVKSGRKSVWNKPATLPSQKPANTAAPVQQPTLDNLSVAGVYDFSRASVNAAILKNESSNLSVGYFVGQNVAPSTLDAVKPDLNRAIDLWGPVFAPTDRISIIWYVQQDLAWAASKYVEESGNPVQWSGILNSCTVNYCGNATATVGANGKFVFEQGMNLGQLGWNRSTAGHEFTHLAQSKLAYPNQQKMPLWLLEGGAQFYGEATGYLLIDPNKTIRSGMHKQYASDASALVATNFSSQSLKQVLAAGNPANTAKLFKLVELEPWGLERTSLAYLLGSYGTEVLVAVYGHQKIVELFREFETSTNWEANFQKVYGISTSTFYEKLTPYLQMMAGEL
jgi:hypothetical protein